MAAPWLPDNSTSKCETCRKTFDFLLRRHHCRICGHIFCDDCSSKRLPVPHGLIVRKPGEPVNALAMMQSPTKVVRVCSNCWEKNRNGFANAPVAMPFAVAASPNLAPGVPSAAQVNQMAYAAAPAAEVPGAAQAHTQAGVAPHGVPMQQVAPAAFEGVRTVEHHPQFSNYGPQHANSGPVALVSPQDEFFEGPPVPVNPGPLPPFPGKTPVQRKDLASMVAQTSATAAAVKAHKKDPHLSAQQNALNLAQKVSAISGTAGQNSVLVNALVELEKYHKPQGIEAGFVISEPPEQGTLAHQFGLSLYDYIYAYENTLISISSSHVQMSKDMHSAFASKGVFVLSVYSFLNQRYRKVHIFMPPGKPNAILGIAAMKLPPNPNEMNGVVSEPSMDIMVKCWRKHGNMYSSNGAAVPLYAGLTPENADLYTKIWRRGGGGSWVSTGEYHPIYNYVRLAEPLYAEAFRYSGSMLIGSGEKAPLPMERMTVTSSPSQQAAPSGAVPQQQQAQNMQQQAMQMQQQAMQHSQNMQQQAMQQQQQIMQQQMAAMQAMQQQQVPQYQQQQQPQQQQYASSAPMPGLQPIQFPEQPQQQQPVQAPIQEQPAGSGLPAGVVPISAGVRLGGGGGGFSVGGMQAGIALVQPPAQVESTPVHEETPGQLGYQAPAVVESSATPIPEQQQEQETPAAVGFSAAPALEIQGHPEQQIPVDLPTSGPEGYLAGIHVPVSPDAPVSSPDAPVAVTVPAVEPVLDPSNPYAQMNFVATLDAGNYGDHPEVAAAIAAAQKLAAEAMAAAMEQQASMLAMSALSPEEQQMMADMANASFAASSQAGLMMAGQAMAAQNMAIMTPEYLTALKQGTTGAGDAHAAALAAANEEEEQ